MPGPVGHVLLQSFNHVPQNAGDPAAEAPSTDNIPTDKIANKANRIVFSPSSKTAYRVSARTDLISTAPTVPSASDESSVGGGIAAASKGLACPARHTRVRAGAILMPRTLLASLLVSLLLGVFQLCTALRLAGRLSIRHRTKRGCEDCHGEQGTHDNGSPDN